MIISDTHVFLILLLC